MLLAKNHQDTFIEATPESIAICPHCQQSVFSKCGEIKAWHWAHKTKCCFESEPETEWHLQWKQLAKQNGCEIEQRNNRHILDALSIENKTAFEFQHSPISLDDLRKRSYDIINTGFKIDWIFDYTYKDTFEFSNPRIIKETDIPFKLKWYNNSYSSLFQNNVPIFGKVYLDMREIWNFFELIQVNYLNRRGTGIGDLIKNSSDVFLKERF